MKKLVVKLKKLTDCSSVFKLSVEKSYSLFKIYKSWDEENLQQQLYGYMLQFSHRDENTCENIRDYIDSLIEWIKQTPDLFEQSGNNRIYDYSNQFEFLFAI